MERHSLDLWPDSDHNQPPRPYFFNVTPEAWPNQTLSEPETYGMAPERIIKIQSRKICTLESQVAQLVKERDRLRESWIFRHFQLFLVLGSEAVAIVAMLIFGAGR